MLLVSMLSSFFLSPLHSTEIDIPRATKSSVCGIVTSDCLKKPCGLITKTYTSREIMEKSHARFLFKGYCPDNITLIGCKKWFDGCNICATESGKTVCSQKVCELPSGPKKCLDEIIIKEL